MRTVKKYNSPYKSGDIVSLIVTTTWHIRGEIAVVKRIMNNNIMEIAYEKEPKRIVSGYISNFRIIKRCSDL